MVISGKRQMSKGIMNSLTKKIGDGEKKKKNWKKGRKRRKKKIFCHNLWQGFPRGKYFSLRKMRKNFLEYFPRINYSFNAYFQWTLRRVRRDMIMCRYSPRDLPRVAIVPATNVLVPKSRDMTPSSLSSLSSFAILLHFLLGFSRLRPRRSTDFVQGKSPPHVQSLL